MLLRQISLLGAESADLVTLSGTSLSPNVVTGLTASPNDSWAEWLFNTDGTVDTNEVTSGVVQFQTGVEWNDAQTTPAVDYWIRATLEDGVNPTSGAAIGSWLKVSVSGSANRIWRWTDTTNGDSTTTGTLKIEIATDSGGTNIVATGYYKGTAIVSAA